MIALAEELMDISKIKIDQSLNKAERLRQYIKDIKDPYQFKVGEVEVSVLFESDGESLQKKMERYFESMIIYSFEK